MAAAGVPGSPSAPGRLVFCSPNKVPGCTCAICTRLGMEDLQVRASGAVEVG